MRCLVGTSGYSYTEWKGSFYPEKLPAAEMLPFYARHFGTVEINNTFYRMPQPAMLARWAGQVGGGFEFVLKAPRRITHDQKLSDGESLRYFAETAGQLGENLGPLFFQLPPSFKKDVGRLREFLSAMPPAARAAFEFRHRSWFDDEVYAALRERGAALCAAQTDEDGDTAPVATAGWGYLRLRRAEYSDGDLSAWADRIRGMGWERAYVFFKHENEARGPAFARRFMEVAQDLCGQG